MPSRTLTTHVFEVEAPRLPPTAAIGPQEQTKVIGALIKLDGRSSVSPNGDELTYTWSVESSPLGSEVLDLLVLEDEGGVVTFVPDRTGEYIFGLTVATPYRTSEKVTGTVNIQALLAPYTLRTTPDGSLMFKALSSFWRMVEERQVFETVWSGYMQAVGADFLRLFQVDFGKSIHTIQSLFQRRWLLYGPGLALDASMHTGMFGFHQSGSGAFTAAGSIAAVGTIVGDREVVLFDGTPTGDAVGEGLVVYTSAGGNAGTYTINRVNSGGSGYIVSASVPFPSPTDEVLASGEDLVTFAGSAEVYVSDLAEDFAAKGVVAGDILRIAAGADSGYYRISAVGTADGLDNERTLLLADAPTVLQSGRAYSIFKALRIYAQRTPSSSTRTVLIPQDEADLTQYETAALEGTGTIRNVFEIVVEERHIFEALIGQQILITSGPDGGTLFTVAGLNDSKTGYLVSSAFGATLFPETTTYEIPVVADISSRVLVLDERTYGIVGAVLDSSRVAVEDGGTGPVWVLTLTEATAPAGREGLEWRIPAVLESDEFADFEELGVSYGDLLVLEVVRQDNGRVSEVPCFVMGAAGNRVAFDVGTAELSAGENGELSNDLILQLARDLYVARATEDPLDGDEILLTETAAEVAGLLSSRAFRTDYYNLPLMWSTPIDLGAFSVRIRAVRIVRNSRIPVADEVASVPSLFEYIDEPEYGEDEDGQLFLVGKDGSLKALSREPLELLENRDFTVSSGASLSGKNLVTTAGSALFRVPAGDLFDRGVRVGDWLEVTSGFDQGRYFVQAIYDSETVKAVTALGAVPATSSEGLQFHIVKRKAGNFVRFVEGMFTPELPAPAHLWAQTTLFDNSDYIEDNFGVMVGISREQLDAYGSSQISYKGAVTALMYVWANGPTLRNVAIGCQVLVGLPVTEGPGRILQIDESYDTSDGTGRILIEDIDHEGNGLGLVRIYYYPSTPDEDTLSEFAGLEINPTTGREFGLGDIVHPFQPLSKSVIVSDYITNPEWWSVTSKNEVEKFHTWQVELDAHQIDSRDMELIHGFCMGIRPIYTKPHVVLVLYLYDEVTVEDQFRLELTGFFADEPGFSLESTHMVDSWNGSSLMQRLLDHGSLATRTLFEGRDLATEAGSGTVTSARGGFTATLDADPLDHALEEPVGVLPGVNAWFPDDVYFRGSPLVKEGDVLFIRTGTNRGRFRVTAVVDDNTLTVEALPGWPPRTLITSRIEEAEGQVFQIQRQDHSTILEGTAEVESYDADADMTVITSEDGNFRWDGVAAGDTLVVTDGADYGTHKILQVGKLDDTYTPGGSEAPDEHLESLETHLIIAGKLTELGDFYIRRDSVRSNPLHEGVGTAAAGSDELTVAGGGLQLLGLQYGDMVAVLSGADAGQAFKVIDVISDTALVVARPFGATGGTLEFVLVRPGLFELDDRRDHAWEAESLTPEDVVTLVLVEPAEDFLAVSDLIITDAAATSASTNLEVAGVSTGMVLEIDNEFDSSGVYAITGMAGDTAAVYPEFPVPAEGAAGTFRQLADDWEVVDDVVTITGASEINLEFGQVSGHVTLESGAYFSYGSTVVTGVGTSFASNLVPGDVIRLVGGGEETWVVVDSIAHDEELVIDREWSAADATGDLEARRTSTPESGVTFTNGSATVTGPLGTAFESTMQVGTIVRLSGDGDLAWAAVSEVVSDLELTLDRLYEGGGGTGDLETGVPGGLVRQGDRFVFETGEFVVKHVRAATMTLTEDTGIAVSANYTGRVERVLT